MPRASRDQVAVYQRSGTGHHAVNQVETTCVGGLGVPPRALRGPLLARHWSGNALTLTLLGGRDGARNYLSTKTPLVLLS